MKQSILTIMLAALLPISGQAQIVNIPEDKMPPQIVKNQNWQFPTKPNAKIVQALDKVLKNYQQQVIKIGNSEDALFYCHNGDHQYKSSFAGFTEASAYYYLLGHLINGEVAYANPNAKPVDYYLKNLNPEILKKFADLAIKNMSNSQKENFLTFAKMLADHYQPFFSTLNDYNLMAYTLTKDKELLNNQFYEFGQLPKPSEDSCYGEWGNESAPIQAEFLRNGEATYFSYYSFTFDGYLYSFWYRRFYHGTAQQTKELLDYVLTKLEK